MAPPSLHIELTRIAVYFAYGRARSLAPAASHSWDGDIAESLGLALRAQGSAETAGEVLCLAQAARDDIASHPQLLSAVTYDKVRRVFVSRLDEVSRVWPPTSQTVRAQLGQGAWNDAMTALGVAVSSRGRARGHVSFSDEEYSRAVVDFLAAVGGDTSFRAYVEWVAREKERGVHRPAGATIRKSYGSWNLAKDAARGVGAQPTGNTISDDDDLS